MQTTYRHNVWKYIRHDAVQLAEIVDPEVPHSRLSLIKSSRMLNVKTVLGSIYHQELGWCHVRHCPVVIPPGMACHHARGVIRTRPAVQCYQ